MHATGGGEVVGRRRGIGRRSDQDVVFQERDASAAFARHAADADVGPQAKAIFDLYGHPGNLPGHALDIGIGESLHVLGPDDVGGPRHAPDVVAGADDRDFLQQRICGFLRKALDSDGNSRDNA